MRGTCKMVLMAIGLAATLPAFAQTPMANPEARRSEAADRLAAAVDRLSFRPDLPAVLSTLALLESAGESDTATKERLTALKSAIDASARAGRNGEALRSAYAAIDLLRGSGGAADAFGSSLALDVQPVADPAFPLGVRLRSVWSEAVPPGTTLSLHLVKFGGGGQGRDLGKSLIAASDLAAQPQRVMVDLRDVQPGSYQLEARAEAGGKLLETVRAPLSLVADFSRQQAEIEAALKSVSGHDDAKATIRYPFSLARELFEGKREVRSYDFTAGVERSRALVAALQAGTDPVARAKGDIRRAYYFAEADSIVPFRLYVPSGWDGKAKLPLVIFLHGANLDDDDSMERADGLFPKLAEQKNVILLAPLGYRMNSMYGAPVPARFATAGSPIASIDPRRVELSEKDVINLVDLISNEYDVDRRRIYLSGNSMGAMGTWHLAQKYPDRWTAIAPAAAGATDDNYDFRRLRGIPIMPVAGEHDFLRPMVEETVAKARAAGLKPNYLMVPGGDHGTGVEMAMPAILDFFLKQKR